MEAPTSAIFAESHKGKMLYLLFPARSLSYPCLEGKILSCCPERGGGN
jgi:hypothetical protein